MVYRLNDKFFGQWLTLHVPFRSMDKFRIPEIENLVPKKFKWFATALCLCSDRSQVPQECFNFWRDPDRIRREMKLEANTDEHIEDVLAMVAGQTEVVDKYLSGELRKEDEPDEVAEGAGQRPRQLKKKEEITYNHKQQLMDKEIKKRIRWALIANHSNDVTAADDARDDAWKENQPLIVLGKGGTGKTTVIKENIRSAQMEGARILFALPTAQLASRMKLTLKDVPGVEVDTCHAAFKLDMPEAETLAILTMYDMVVVDEISFLDKPQFERIMKLWQVAGRVPALVILGDKYQLPGVGKTRPWESTAWRRPHCKHLTLTQAWRQAEDLAFEQTLDTLRYDKPSQRMLLNICKGHKAWNTDKPTLDDIKELFEKHPHTTIVTCTRAGAEEINGLAFQANFGDREPLAVLPGEVDINPDNYTAEHTFRDDRQPIPTRVPICKGMKLYLTQNVRKEDDFVNGMEVKVESFKPNAHAGALIVKTKTGHRLVVTMWTNTKVKNHAARHFPIRMGYASTIHKVQGDEFDHITIWLNKRCMPAAGYTALSRVRNSKSYMLGGKLTCEHFVPATWAYAG